MSLKVALLACSLVLIPHFIKACGDTNSKCASWAGNGFCESTFYTQETKMEMCGDTCGLCGGAGGGGGAGGAGGAASCGNDASACASWAANGFCTSTFYTQEKKAEMCPNICGLCGGGDGDCVDSSSSCAAWANNGFCTSTFYTEEVKAQYCAATCQLCGAAGGTTADSGATDNGPTAAPIGEESTTASP